MDGNLRTNQTNLKRILKLCSHNIRIGVIEAKFSPSQVKFLRLRVADLQDLGAQVPFIFLLIILPLSTVFLYGLSQSVVRGIACIALLSEQQKSYQF